MDYGVRNVKCYDEGENIRLTFAWPPEVEQVYIFINEDAGRLFTLQEYKKCGGIVTCKTPGGCNYSIYASAREDGEDVLWEQTDGLNQATFVHRIPIDFALREKVGKYKNHEITLTAQHQVSRGAVACVKKMGGYPQNLYDGVVYYFCEIETSRPLIRTMRTTISEYIRLFVAEGFEDLYSLRGVKA